MSIAATGMPVVAQPGFLTAFGHQLSIVPLPAPLRLMPFAAMLAGGINLAFSSDYPAASIEPWAGIAAAVNRTDRRGRPILEAEAISVRDALMAYTASAADVAGIEGGRLIPGAPADVIWVDRDPLKCTSDRLASITTLATWTDGHLRHSHPLSGVTKS